MRRWRVAMSRYRFLLAVIGCAAAVAAAVAFAARSGPARAVSQNTIVVPDGSDAAIGQHTSIAIDSAGRPVVTYRDATEDDLKFLRCGDATCPADNVIARLATSGNVGAFSSLKLDADGNPVVSYYYNTFFELHVVRCGNPTCTEHNMSSAPDQRYIVGSDTSLALDDGGSPVGSYYDASHFDLKVLRCRNPTCTDGQDIT